MPEEINRIVVDAISSWLFTPSADADENLLAEGVDPSRIHLVGNIMVDSLLASLPKAMQSDDSRRARDRRLPVRRRHAAPSRRSSTMPTAFACVLGALDEIATQAAARVPCASSYPGEAWPISGSPTIAPHLKIVDPVGYLDFLRLEADASLVLTDSGGVQEETTVLGVPCLTLRENTERPITITNGTNQLVGLDPERIRAGGGTWRSPRAASGPPATVGRTHRGCGSRPSSRKGTPGRRVDPSEVAPLVASRLGVDVGWST